MNKQLDLSKPYKIWFGTWNNPPDESKEGLKKLHEKLDAKYTRGQLEEGEEMETHHFQFVTFLKENKRLTGMKKVNNQIHWEPSKSKSANNYVWKDETRIDGPWEFGTIPKQGAPLAKKKIDWDDVWEKACNQEIHKINAWVRICHYSKLKDIAKDHLKIVDSDHVRGIWVHGEFGTGKSRWFRDNIPIDKLYPKLCNKWWDGYTGQPVVVMDDLDKSHECLAQQIKIWGDRYGCILETKGGAETARYDWFVVTSQYHIDEIFTEEATVGALKRRYQEFEIEDIEQLRNVIDLDKYKNN